MQALINAIKHFVNLTEEDISVIEQLFVKKELKENERLLTEGEVCKEFIFVEKGLIRHSVNNDGKDETIFFSAENDFVCDFESFVNKAPSKKTFVTLEDTTVYCISYNNMQLFYKKVSTGERFGRLYLEMTFAKAIEHIVTTLTGTAEQRYLIFLSNFKHIQQRIPQYYIASFIGVTPQSLSRIRREMVKV
jgi:CRP-like cAMP-binding protein